MSKGDRRFDKRILDRNLRSGAITQAEYEKYLKKLEDLGSEVSTIETRLRPADKKVPRGSVDEDDEL